MGIRDRVRDVGGLLASYAGDALLGFGEELVKAKDPSEREEDRGSGDEGNERAPGGAKEDNSDNAPVPTEPAEDDPKSLFWDPYAVVEQLGYKERPSSITYQTLKAMVWKTPIVQAIIQTRINQIASFAQPQMDRYSLGFRLKLRDSAKEPTAQDKKWMEQMTSFVMRTGVTENPRGRDSFEMFLRKFAWDSLVYDQACFETVPNKAGQPAEFYAVDGATIRLADSATTYLNEDLDKAVRYVQVYDGMIIAEYTQDEMCFGVRNPRTDLKLSGYGTSELEMLMSTITALLWALEYNKRAFSQGSVHKGILNFKGAIPDKQMRAFRRHWYTSLASVQNAWRTPITNAEELQWISMHQSNRDMEYNAYADFLIKVACSMFSMDPVEVNFKYGNSGQKSGLQEASNKEKITESKERGLRPILRFIASCMNRHVIWPISEDFELDFVGLDAATRDDLAKLNAQRSKTTWTVDELRAEEDKPPLPDGNGEVILDPTWLQYVQGKEAAAQAEEQGDQQGFPGAEDEDDEESAFLRQFEDDDDDEDEDDNEAARPAERNSGLKGKPGQPPNGNNGKPAPFGKSFGSRPSQKLVVDIEL